MPHFVVIMANGLEGALVKRHFILLNKVKKGGFMKKSFKMFLAAILLAITILGCKSTLKASELDAFWSSENITITTEAQLRELATLVNNGTRDFKGQTIGRFGVEA